MLASEPKRQPQHLNSCEQPDNIVKPQHRQNVIYVHTLSDHRGTRTSTNLVKSYPGFVDAVQPSVVNGGGKLKFRWDFRGTFKLTFAVTSIDFLRRRNDIVETLE